MATLRNKVLRKGTDVTLVGASWATRLALEVAQKLETLGVSCEVVDCRILNPFDGQPIIDSIKRTGRLIAVDGSWATCGLSAEILARAVEGCDPSDFRSAPRRVTLAEAPAPSSSVLEALYYPKADMIVKVAQELCKL